MDPLDGLIAIFNAAPDLIRRHPVVALFVGLGFGALFAAMSIAAKRGNDR